MEYNELSVTKKEDGHWLCCDRGDRHICINLGDCKGSSAIDDFAKLASRPHTPEEIRGGDYSACLRVIHKYKETQFDGYDYSFIIRWLLNLGARL
jgi:hypothetical protein